MPGLTLDTSLLHPLLAMLLLVLVVWVVMFATRFKAIAAAKLDAQQLATPEDVNRLLPDSARNPGNNFKNLFEVPVLFYVLVIYLTIMGSATELDITLAWVFVGFRALHSLIQCTYNNVNHRFGAYAISCLALWVMLIKAILQVF